MPLILMDPRPYTLAGLGEISLSPNQISSRSTIMFAAALVQDSPASERPAVFLSLLLWATSSSPHWSFPEAAALPHEAREELVAVLVTESPHRAAYEAQPADLSAEERLYAVYSTELEAMVVDDNTRTLAGQVRDNESPWKGLMEGSSLGALLRENQHGHHYALRHLNQLSSEMQRTLTIPVSQELARMYTPLLPKLDSLLPSARSALPDFTRALPDGPLSAIASVNKQITDLRFTPLDARLFLPKYPPSLAPPAILSLSPQVERLSQQVLDLHARFADAAQLPAWKLSLWGWDAKIDAARVGLAASMASIAPQLMEGPVPRISQPERIARHPSPPSRSSGSEHISEEELIRRIIALLVDRSASAYSRKDLLLKLLGYLEGWQASEASAMIPVTNRANVRVGAAQGQNGKRIVAARVRFNDVWRAVFAGHMAPLYVAEEVIVGLCQPVHDDVDLCHVLGMLTIAASDGGLMQEVLSAILPRAKDERPLKHLERILHERVGLEKDRVRTLLSPMHTLRDLRNLNPPYHPPNIEGRRVFERIGHPLPLTDPAGCWDTITDLYVRCLNAIADALQSALSGKS